MRDILHLNESQLYETKADSNGQVIEANFYINATGDRTGSAVYLLSTIAQAAYDLWYFEHNTEAMLPLEGEPEPGVPQLSTEENIFPLVVPDSVLENSGLVEHVSQAYLDVAAPERLNEIAQFLLRIDSDISDA